MTVPTPIRSSLLSGHVGIAGIAAYGTMLLVETAFPWSVSPYFDFRLVNVLLVLVLFAAVLGATSGMHSPRAVQFGDSIASLLLFLAGLGATTTVLRYRIGEAAPLAMVGIIIALFALAVALTSFLWPQKE